MNTVVLSKKITKKQLKELISEMPLENTLDNLQNYHESSFENYEVFEKDEVFISMNVSVDTSFINEKISIDHVQISNVELWVNEEEESYLTDEMIMTIQNEITNKIKELI